MSDALPEDEVPCVYGCIYCEGGCGECVNCHGCECASRQMSGRLYTPATGVQDRREFLAMLDRIGVDSYTVIDETGRPTIALDRAGTEQLRDWFAERGDAAQAVAIQRSLDAA